MKDGYRPLAIFDDDLRARSHACHQRSKVARRFRLRNVDHILGHKTIIHRYLLMLWPSACVCSCTWLRVDDGSISCAEHTDSRLASIADRCDTSRESWSASWPLSFV